MSCRICKRNNCTESFHSFEAQEEHDEKYGEYENQIDELKDEIKRLKAENKILYGYITNEYINEVDEKLASL
ncbi:MAG: hypothetical protein UR73_C0038G0022 [candidate division WS6 bacterium GW2011_GWF1_35_23]|uniref:Uncharacterized protein n=1 Tax=candidate division WS6 bacterium GW2011_GWF1_35_23 TaxID=1619097 RepID=A0A0G0BZ05_9BACT|nr:MAG: hypothetical protein UR73_C0038G0022 [candidate division WS6 bacterium GW2011_GWF1_35_23]